MHRSYTDISEYGNFYPYDKKQMVKQMEEKPLEEYLSRLSITTLSAERLNLFLHAADEAPEDSAIGELIPNNIGLHATDETPSYAGKSRRSTFKPEEPRWKKKAKIILPHVGLVCLSMFYTVMGALIFYAIEEPHEHRLKRKSLDDLDKLRQNLTRNILLLTNVYIYNNNINSNINNNNNSRMETIYEEQLQNITNEHLDKIMTTLFEAFHKNYVTLQDLQKNGSDTMWSFTSSLFFSATVITAIGYGHLVPQTTEGRVACLIFCLIGIPLILVTIADMGRFLSVYVIKLYRLYSKFLSLIAKGCAACCRKLTPRPKPTSTDQTSSAAAPEGSQAPGGSQVASEATNATEIVNENKDRTVSIMFILIILIGYTAFGAMLLKLWEPWSFFESFYYCFITVTTIGFGDFIPQNQRFIPATLMYIIVGLIITTMCIDLVGSQYIREIHFFGRNVKNITQQALITIGGRVVHLSDIFGYVAYLQRSFGLTTEQLEKMAGLPDEYLLDCLIHGRQPNLNYMGIKPYIPNDIYSIKWIEQPRTLSYTSEKVLASIESLDVTSRCSTARTPREWYYHMIMEHMKDTKI